MTLLARGMVRAVVGLGSNLAHPRRQIARALRAIMRLPRTQQQPERSDVQRRFGLSGDAPATIEVRIQMYVRIDPARHYG